MLSACFPSNKVASVRGCCCLADCVGVVAAALKGEFAPAWKLLYPQVLKFCRSSRPELDVSMGIGVIAEVSRFLPAPLAHGTLFSSTIAAPR